MVDFAELGGGVTAGCADLPDGSRAHAILRDAGYTPTMATRQPGFVCRVNGVPTSDPCVDTAPADAYWSVWWADGDGGAWVYSARGVDSLRVPDGGYLALAWHQGSGRSQPPATVPVSRHPRTTAAKPTTRPSTPSQSKSAQDKSAQSKAPRRTEPAPEGGGSKSSTQTPDAREVPGNGSASPSADAPESGTASSKASAPSASTAPSDTPSPGESVAVDPQLPSATDITAGPESVVVDSKGDDDGGLPVWAPIGVVLAVVAGGAAFVVTRRRMG